MPEPFADSFATVAAGRTAFIARLQALATRAEQLPLDATAEVLVLLEPALAALEQQAARAGWRTMSECGTPHSMPHPVHLPRWPR